MKYLLFVFGLAAFNPAFAQDDLPVQNTNDLVISAMNNAAMQNTLPENKRDNCYLRASSKECQSKVKKSLGSAVQLPAGWSISVPAKNGVARLARRDSSDIVLAGVMPFADARQIVQQLSAQETPAFSVERVLPIRTVAGGILQSGAALKSADGKPASKYVFALPLANGTTALTALYTTEQQVGPQLEASIKGMIDIITQLKAGRTMGGASAVAATAVPRARGPAGVPQPPLSASAALPANIAYIGFHGYSTDTRPTILYKNGIICDCMAYAFGATDPLAFKNKYPGDFGRWRKRSDGKYEYLFDQSTDTVWSELGGGPAKPLPANWRTQGTYSYFSSSGFADNMTSSTSSYTFGQNGRFHTGSTITSTATSGGASVFAGGEGGQTSGRYQISGWILQLIYDDGRTVRKTITWQRDPDVIWINGTGYVRG
jgi:hypothetical protein